MQGLVRLGLLLWSRPWLRKACGCFMDGLPSGFGFSGGWWSPPCMSFMRGVSALTPTIVPTSTRWSSSSAPTRIGGRVGGRAGGGWVWSSSPAMPTLIDRCYVLLSGGRARPRVSLPTLVGTRSWSFLIGTITSPNICHNRITNGLFFCIWSIRPLEWVQFSWFVCYRRFPLLTCFRAQPFREVPWWPSRLLFRANR